MKRHYCAQCPAWFELQGRLDIHVEVVHEGKALVESTGTLVMCDPPADLRGLAVLRP